MIIEVSTISDKGRVPHIFTYFDDYVWESNMYCHKKLILLMSVVL